MMLDELLHMSEPDGDGFVGIQVALSLVRHQFPWLYDAGNEVIGILRSRRKVEVKRAAIERFQGILEFTFRHPMMREMYGGSKEMHFFYRRLPDFLMQAFARSVPG